MNKPDPLSREAYIMSKFAQAGIAFEPDDSGAAEEPEVRNDPVGGGQNASVDAQAPSMSEGAIASVTLDRYERSRAARRACIAAHGATCAICGFDFAKAYGPQFAGIVQVHHIVPLHQTAGNHEVDPVRDLIPVCPNCHVALHSKPDGGTYLPSELRDLLSCSRR